MLLFIVKFLFFQEIFSMKIGLKALILEKKHFKPFFCEEMGVCG